MSNTTSPPAQPGDYLIAFKEMLDLGCGLEENKFSFSFLFVPGYLMGVE